jgi:HprK-related kinase A
MKIGELPQRQLVTLLANTGLPIQLGPFNINIRSNLSKLAQILYELYAQYPLIPAETFIDIHVEVSWKRGLRRWIKPQISFLVDGRSPMAPYTPEHAFPALEWGINWCIATRAHQFLMLHSAVVERGGLAMLLPAAPGHGKSTLCTALAHSGWRLLSDEFGLVRLTDGLLLPLPRLIPLKNESIDVIKRFRPEAVFGPAFYGTRKGTVAHVRPPADSIQRMHEPARPRWFVFPRWVKDAPLTLQPLPKSQAFLMVATNAFNYEVLDEAAFRQVVAMVEASDCYTLVYSDLDEALAALDALARTAHA